MPASRATTAWVVSGAIGLVTFSAGMIASQSGGEAVPARPQPAVTVTPGARPTASPTSTSPTATATAPASETASTGPSPVSPPSAETPD